MQYLNNTQTGRSDIYSWLIVFWMMMATWLIGQTVLLFGPMMQAMATDPEFAAAMQSSAEPGATSALSMISGFMMVLGSLGTAFVLIITAFNKGESRSTGRKIGGWLAGISVLGMIGTLAFSDDGGANAMLGELMGKSPVTFGLMLLSFPAALIGLYLGQKKVHHRTLTQLHTGAPKIRWGWMIQGVLVIWAVLGTYAFISHSTGMSTVEMTWDPARFWPYAIVSLLLIPWQSGTEEIIFRGYLNQGLHHFLRNKWVVFIITSLAFMAMHLANPEALEGAEKGILPIVMSGYFVFGFACCLLVWLDDGLETAIGVHAGNNMFAAIFINYENSVLPTPSIFLTRPDAVKDSFSTIFILGLVVLIFWMLRGRKSLSD